MTRKTPNRSNSKGSNSSSSSSQTKNPVKDHIILTTETEEEMRDRLNGFLMLCAAMNIQVDRSFDVGARGALGGYCTTKIPRKCFNCSDAMYLMLQQVMDQYEQKNNRMQAVKTIYHILFFLGWSSVLLPYITSTVPLSVSSSKFSAQVIFLLLCLSYLEGWAIHGVISKINMWDVLKITYRICFFYVFVSEISYAQHLHGLPLALVSWSFTENIKHAHGVLTSYAFSPLLNNKWYQVNISLRPKQNFCRNSKSKLTTAIMKIKRIFSFQIGSSVIFLVHKAAFVLTLPMMVIGEVWCIQEMLNDYQFRSLSTAFVLLVIYCIYGIVFFLNYLNCLQVWIKTSSSNNNESENVNS